MPHRENDAPRHLLGPTAREFRAWLDTSDHPKHSGREHEFDSQLDVRWRWPSEIHWTPILVCKKIALLLDPAPGARVLDIGSGVGKFCIVGASVTQAEFVGVEAREHLVEQSRKASARLGAHGARFICGNAFDLDWAEYQALYLYNPFEEAQFPEECCIDDTQPNGVELFQQSVTETVFRLEHLQSGVRVATFHGFGADMPPGYDRLFVGEVSGGTLEVFEKL